MELGDHISEGIFHQLSVTPENKDHIGQFYGDIDTSKIKTDMEHGWNGNTQDDSLSPFFLAEGSRLFQNSSIPSNTTQEAVFMAGQLKQEK